MMEFYARGNWVMKRRKFWFDKKYYNARGKEKAKRCAHNFNLVWGKTK